MKKKNKGKVLWGLALVISMLITGCGGSGSYSSGATADTAAAAEYYEEIGYDTGEIYMSEAQNASAEMPAEEDEAEAGTDSSSPQVQNTQRKLIKTVNLDVETETFDTLMANVYAKTESLGGYVESSYTYNGSNYRGNQKRNANLTLRIPAEHLEEFLSAVSEISNVISRNDNVTDITLQYVDMQSHKEALKTEQTRLLELLEQAESVEDIITIESRLSEVRYQIESMESQLRTMDNQVSYSTVYLYIDEVARLTPVKEQTTWEKISTGFSESLYHVGNGIKNFFIGILINLPYLVVWAVILLIAFFAVKGIIKIRRTKRMKKEMKRTEMLQAKAEDTQKEEEKGNE